MCLSTAVEMNSACFDLVFGNKQEHSEKPDRSEECPDSFVCCYPIDDAYALNTNSILVGKYGKSEDCFVADNFLHA